MNKEYDLLVFIGRFAPFHNEHKRVIDIALQKAKNVLVLVGSSGKARTVRNPFTFDERRDMIDWSFKADDAERIIIKPLYDKTYNDNAWINQVQHIVKETALDIVNDYGFRNIGINDAKIGLIGANKDHTSYYLKLFPQWNSVGVQIHDTINATDIRHAFFEDQDCESFIHDVPVSVSNFLNVFSDTLECEILRKEYWFVQEYKEQWEKAPYPVKHMTVDCLIEQSGHILVVKRRSEPGRGLMALPGGHLEEYEKLEDGAIRELKEETKIKVPEAVLRGSIVNRHIFDDPHRSMIGRVITYAIHIKLKDDVSLPVVKGSDDAEKAFWMPIGDMKEDMFFDDHFHMANCLLGI